MEIVARLRERSKRLNWYRGLAIIFIVGLAGHLIALSRPLMLTITPYTLLITGLIAIHPLIAERNKRVLWWMTGCGVTAFTVEIAGVNSGVIFGSYRYGEVLGLKLWGVPLIIGWNWMIVLLGSAGIASLLVKHRAVAAALGTGLMVLLDLVLEPVAMKLDYWHWNSTSVPIRNYAVWGAISMIGVCTYVLLGCKQESRLPSFYFVVLLAYLAALSLLL